MAAEDHKNMKKVQCWIPLDTWDRIVSLGYDRPTVAVTKAFEKLLEDSREDPRVNPPISQKNPIESHEIPIYKARIESLEIILGEKDRSIERLESDLNKAGQREEDLMQIHNNYMLQIQSLISQRALSAPSGSRTTKEGNRKKQEETGSPREETGPTKKAGIVIECLNCGKPFAAARSTRMYCSGACKEAYRRKRKKNNQP
jgi:hypothetical protein